MLKRVPVFASCTQEQLQVIADRTRLVEYKKGELIYREGDAADAFYIVSSGRLRLFVKEGERDRTLTILHNGDSFGEISLLIGERHSASVQAVNDTLVLQLQKKDFEEVINRIPSLVLYLSRMLSKRLRNREHGGEFSDATIVCLYSAARGVGRTYFGVGLATMLTQETGKSVVLVDFSGTDDTRVLYGDAGAPRRTPTGLTPEAVFEGGLSAHPLGFSVLAARELFTAAGSETHVAPLFSLLTNQFQYIVVDLPVDLSPSVLKALTQSDLIYLITNPQREHVIRTNALIEQLQGAMEAVEQRIKVVLNLRDGGGELGLTDMRQPAALTLPHIGSESGLFTPKEFARLLKEGTAPYALAVRHVARELGGLLVGLALGSGAALGLAHIGVLKVLEREKIPVDIVAGTSIGALVGGLWAAGYSAAELERLALRFKNPWNIRKLFLLDLGIPIFSLFVGIVAGALVGWLAGFWTGLLFGFMVSIAIGVVVGPLTGGPIQGARLMRQLEQDFGNKTFDDTWVPLKVVAANPIAREEIVFESGRLADAVRASVSIPGIFKPVIMQGKLCLDGGVVNPIPVSVLKRYGANHVIAVNVFPTTLELIANRQEMLRRRVERDATLATRSLPVRLLYRLRQELIRSVSPLVFDIIMRSMQSMEYQIAEVSCREADLILRPTVPGSHWLEFFNPEKFIQRGEEVALQHLPELKRITRLRSVDNP